MTKDGEKGNGLQLTRFCKVRLYLPYLLQFQTIADV